MPRTAIPVQTIGPYSLGDIDLAYTAGDSANGMEFVNDGETFVHVQNEDASAKTVTFVGVATQKTFNVATDYDLVVAAGDRGVMHCPPQAFNQADGTVQIDLASDTNLSIAVFKRIKTPN